MRLPIYKKSQIIEYAEVDDTYIDPVPERKWRLTDDGYVYRHIERRRVFLHRLIAETPEKYFTDHIDGNRLNNQKSNLRICTTAQNLRNRKRHKNNKHEYKGISKHETVDGAITYRAQIRSEYLGTYRTAEEAARVYDKAAMRLFGEFARLNFPIEPTIEPTKINLKRTTSNPYHGIAWVEAKQKWRSRIYVDNRCIFLGYYDDPESAARVYDDAVIAYSLSEKKLNFPQVDTRKTGW